MGGSLATTLLDMLFKRTFPAINFGNLIAGILIMMLSHGAVVGIMVYLGSFFKNMEFKENRV